MYEVSLLTHNWLIKRRLNALVRARLSDIRGLVLDFGCGLRPFEIDICKIADAYIGVDWSATIHGLRANVVVDLNGPVPFGTAVADHVTSFEVLEHLSEPATMLSEAHRVLRNGGLLTLSVPFQWWIHEAPWDYQRYTRFGLEYQLTKAGFTDIHVKATTGFWSMWLLKLNYQLMRAIRGPKAVRRLVRVILIPIWLFNQILGMGLDHLFFDERETAGYFVTARKP